MLFVMQSSIAGISGLLGQTTTTSPPTTPPPETATATNVGAAFALGFGVITILMVLLFVFWDRERTGERLEKLVAAGRNVEPVPVPAQIALEAEAITLLGPSNITVGMRASYRAQRNSQEVAVTWSASDEDVQKQLPANTASSVEFTPRRPGTFTLRASDGSNASELTVKSAEVVGVAQQLPYIGVGWGSIVVGLAIASVTGALGLKGTISGEAVATILGALVGYVVAKGQAETSKTEGSSGEPKS